MTETSAHVTLVYFGDRSDAEMLFARMTAVGHQGRLVPGLEWCSPHGAHSIEPVVLFLASPDVSRQEILSALHRRSCRSVLAVFASNGTTWDEEIAVRCADFLYWPCDDRELKLRLGHTFATDRIPESPQREPLLDDFITLHILGESPALRTALRSVRSFAASDAPVLIDGETGTGKELVSRAIHYFSPRRDQPFIPITCGAIPDNLLENELFGHERGAYTDARERRAGLVEQAHGGTLFLDEVESLSPKIQAAVLRFLETHEYRPLGSATTQCANLRIVAATNVALDDMARKGLFRRDLLYRLDVLKIRLPRLSARANDIRILAEHFVREFAQRYGKPVRSIGPRTMEWMMRYEWPGNVRELQNLLQREVLLATEPVLHIPEGTVVCQRPSDDYASDEAIGFRRAKARAIELFEKRFLRSVMVETHGNVSEAARRIGKDRRSLGKLLKKHGITTPTG